MTEESGYQLVALVPMRHESERVPQKNYRLVAGSPLYSFILNTLNQVPAIESIVVDTDSPIIKEGLARDFPFVKVLSRPQHLLGADVPMNDILLYDVSIVRSKYYLQTHSTNPLLSAVTIASAIEQFLQNQPGHNALFGVTKRQVRLWGEDGSPLNHNPDRLIKTQDLTPFYEENSCIYLFSREAMIDSRNRLGSNPMMFEVPPLEAFDIDTELDFQLVKTLIEAGFSSRVDAG